MTRYAFDDFCLDEGARVLTRDGARVPLTPRVFDTLLHLVARGGELVGKDELIAAVWPGRVVEDNNVDQSISTLRRVLGERPGEHRYILTVPKRGYRFIANVSLSAAPATPSMPLRTLAVLPFASLQPDARDEAHELGMADTLIARLNGLGALVVRPLSAVRRLGTVACDPFEAGRRLAVDAVLDGSIQRAGDRVRVCMRLLDVAVGTQQWADVFDLPAGDVFALQDAVAEKAAAALALRLTYQQRIRLTRRYTDNPDAWRSFALARFCLDQRSPAGLLQAVTHFREALALDPGYVLAWAGLSDAYAVQGVFGTQPPHAIYPPAREAALHAMAIDDRLPQPHAALGHVLAQYDHDWAGAELAYRRALELDPNCTPACHRYAILLMTTGRGGEAFAQIRRARELDPTSLPIDVTEGFLHYWARDPQRAIEHLSATLSREPHFWMAHYWLAQAQAAAGDPAAALASARRAHELVHDNGASWLVAWAQARAGLRDEALARLAGLIAWSRDHYVPPYDIAQVHAGLGDTREVFAWLQRACEDRSRGLDNLRVNPIFDGLRGDPCMAEFAGRIGATLPKKDSSDAPFEAAVVESQATDGRSDD